MIEKGRDNFALFGNFHMYRVDYVSKVQSITTYSRGIRHMAPGLDLAPSGLETGP